MAIPTVPTYKREAVTSRSQHAVVLGAGIGGLFAARVLADAFERITIIERDPHPDDPQPRNGVPQGNHVHALLEAGRVTLNELFPGFEDDIQAAGGLTIDAATEFHYFHGGDYLADGSAELPMICASRPLFEAVLYDRVSDIDEVTFRRGCVFRDYRYDEPNTAVTGVTITAASGHDETLDASLVVDAMGRSSPTPRWLETNGMNRPPVDEVRIDLAYSTAIVRRPTTARDGYLIGPDPTLLRGGTALPVEQDRWIVTLFGLHGDHPPTERTGFRDFAASLPTPALREIVDGNTWASDGIRQYPFPSNRWHHYERVDQLPAGLVPIGDAVASFNPIYGQGMSVAALEAMHLHRSLISGDPGNLTDRYKSRIADVIADIWRMTVSADFEFSETEGPKPLGTDLFNWYMSRVIQAAHTDGEISDTLARVLRLERKPSSLLRPRTVARVFSPL